MKNSLLQAVLTLTALLIPVTGPAGLQVVVDELAIERRDLEVREAVVSADFHAAAARFNLSADAIDAGRVVALDGGRIDVVNRNNLSDLLNSRAMLIETLRLGVVVSDPPPVLAGEGFPVFELPYEILLNRPAGGPLKLKPYARDSTGLSLSGADNALKGTIHVALIDTANDANTSALPEPVPVVVTAPGAIDIDPSPVPIVGLGRWHPVSLTVAPVAGDVYPVSVSANPASSGEPIEIAVSRPTARLWSNPGAIVGWGIGQATINVRVTGMLDVAGFKVPLSTTNGALDADTVTLDNDGLGSVPLRSSADAETVIEIELDEVKSEPLQVRFKAPWLFLLAAIAGGVTGAFLRGRGRKKWIKALAIGAASAIVMTLAYAIGIDWMARLFDTAVLARSGEALVFVLGAIGALVGVNFLIAPEADS